MISASLGLMKIMVVEGLYPACDPASKPTATFPKSPGVRSRAEDESQDKEKVRRGGKNDPISNDLFL